MPQFNGPNKKRINPRYYLKELLELPGEFDGPGAEAPQMDPERPADQGGDKFDKKMACMQKCNKLGAAEKAIDCMTKCMGGALGGAKGAPSGPGGRTGEDVEVKGTSKGYVCIYNKKNLGLVPELTNDEKSSAKAKCEAAARKKGYPEMSIGMQCGAQSWMTARMEKCKEMGKAPPPVQAGEASGVPGSPMMEAGATGGEKKGTQAAIIAAQQASIVAADPRLVAIVANMPASANAGPMWEKIKKAKRGLVRVVGPGESKIGVKHWPKWEVAGAAGKGAPGGAGKAAVAANPKRVEWVKEFARRRATTRLADQQANQMAIAYDALVGQGKHHEALEQLKRQVAFLDAEPQSK